MAWQRATSYGRRSLGETAIGRYKHLIGPKLRARRSLAYRRSIPARPDSNRMAVLKRSVGRASFSSSCLRSHIGTK